jgi:hypothetical protein
MYFKDDAIIDVPLSAEIEADLVQCFVGFKEMVVFGVAEINKNEKEYLEKMGVEVDAKIIFDSMQPVLHSYESCHDWINGRSKKKISWYTPNTMEDLKLILEYLGITFKCRILQDGKEAIDFKYELYFYEHHLIADGDNFCEHRSLLINKTSYANNFEEEVLPKIQFFLQTLKS